MVPWSYRGRASPALPWTYMVIVPIYARYYLAYSGTFDLAVTVLMDSQGVWLTCNLVFYLEYFPPPTHPDFQYGVTNLVSQLDVLMGVMMTKVSREYFKTFIIFRCVCAWCVHIWYMWPDVHAQVRRQLYEISSLLLPLRWFLESNSGHQAFKGLIL